MPAAIVHGSQFAIIATDDDQRIVGEREREVIAGPRGLTAEPGEKPAPPENVFHVDLEDRVTHVKVAGKAVARTALGDQIGERCGHCDLGSRR